MTTSLAEGKRSPVALGRLWAGLVLAPTAWSVAELCGYNLAARTCGRGAVASNGRAGLTQDLLAFGLGLIAVVGLAIAVGNWRHVRDGSRASETSAWGRAEFMALAGVVVSSLFVLGIGFFALPPFLVDACNQVR